jgi:hypothetical protein
VKVVWVGRGGTNAEVEAQPGQQQWDLVLLRLLPEHLPKLLHLLGMLGRQIVGLREVVGQVVELQRSSSGLPDVRGELAHRVRRRIPRDPVDVLQQPPGVEPATVG